MKSRGSITLPSIVVSLVLSSVGSSGCGGSAESSLAGSGGRMGFGTGAAASGGGGPTETDCNLADCEDVRHECTICRLGEECVCPDGTGCGWALDRDGDGYRIAQFPGDGSEEGAFSVCSQVRFFDCDDDDPLFYYPGYFDRDGDGYAGEETCTYPGQEQVIQFLPSRFRHAPDEDCDDNDASKNRMLYVDNDDDGRGVSGNPLCASPGPNLSIGGGDCDDDDPELPADLEIEGDGIDSDCDGIDGTELGPNETCDAQHAVSPPVCDGTDLVLFEACEPDNCPARRLLTIGNRGVEPFVGLARIVGSSGTLQVPLSLAPGEMSERFTIYIDYLDSLELMVDETDCDPSTNFLPQAWCHYP